MSELQNRCLYNIGDVIVEEGQPGNHIYIIEKGRAEVWKKNSEGNKKTLGFLNTGQIFGEIAIIEKTKRTATVTAIEPTVIISIQGDRLLDVLQKSPPIITTLIKTLITNLKNAQSK